MKRTATALVLGSLIVATQAVAADWLTTIDPYGDPVHLSAHSTYADTQAGDRGRQVGSSFTVPDDGELVHLPARSTYADVHAGDRVSVTGSSFPVPDDGELIPLQARSTYADQFAAGHAQAANSAPAGAAD